MAKFKVVTPAGASFTAPGAGYDFEMEALGPVGAEIVEIPAGTEDEFIKAACHADALYAKGRPITKGMIDGLERCQVIALGTSVFLSLRRERRQHNAVGTTATGTR